MIVKVIPKAEAKDKLVEPKEDLVMLWNIIMKN